MPENDDIRNDRLFCHLCTGELGNAHMFCNGCKEINQYFSICLKCYNYEEDEEDPVDKKKTLDATKPQEKKENEEDAVDEDEKKNKEKKKKGEKQKKKIPF